MTKAKPTFPCSAESAIASVKKWDIWLTQKMMSALYDVDVRTINEHIQKIYEDGELTEEATIRNFRIVQTEGSRQVSRQVKHYNLQMIIAVGFKVNNDRAVQFRKWANTIVKDYTIQGWAMDSDRLKNGGSVLTKEYFDHLLEQIREIRMSERKFYQKITDIYATALDYDKSAKTTRLFFSEVQNKLHWAIHRHTAAELIVERANAEKPHMPGAGNPAPLRTLRHTNQKTRASSPGRFCSTHTHLKRQGWSSRRWPMHWRWNW